MCASSNDRILFEKAIKRVNNFLRISGLKIISQEPESGNKWFCQRCLNSLGIIAFSVGPILSSMFHYYKTGELSFLLPFLLLYPFDPYNIYFFPFVYIHQIWSAIISVFFIFGPDSFLYTSCVLVNVQYFYLKQEIETIFGYRSPLLNEMDSMEQKSKIAYIVRRHLQLLRCATLIERIYTESTLCNVLTSSLLICFTGFNVTAFGNYLAVVAPFFAFLTIVIGQIYLLCYYGNLLAESNAEISEAIYNCVWYRENVPIAKHMLFIAARAQKPCKITAYGFADIDMRAFAKIISSSWSYFAMLSSFHNNDSEK
ncbi:odorant receptor 4-like [Battus philenor]|uniref:odorant receptor 4-like n=1 Tax=Battus philenor TaxID=42288 RepID=UPI0035CFEDCB